MSWDHYFKDGARTIARGHSKKNYSQSNSHIISDPIKKAFTYEIKKLPFTPREKIIAQSSFLFQFKRIGDSRRLRDGRRKKSTHSQKNKFKKAHIPLVSLWENLHLFNEGASRVGVMFLEACGFSTWATAATAAAAWLVTRSFISPLS